MPLPGTAAPSLHGTEQRAGASRASAGFRGTYAASPHTGLVGGRLQRKLVVNEPGDAYEREADRVAEQVMGLPEPSRDGAWKPAGPRPAVQRRLGGSVGSATMAAPSAVEDVLSAPGRPLDSATRVFFEDRFGYDFSRVRVHADGKAAGSAQMVDALAYTVGRNIVFGAGQYSPGTRDGRRLMAHELAHVVQQDPENRLVGDRPPTGRLARQATDPEGPEHAGPGWAAVNKLGIVYKESGVNLREQASTAGSPLARLPQSTKVHILSHHPESHWLAVSVVGDAVDQSCGRAGHVGTFGYVSDDYVWWKTPLPDTEAVLYPVQGKDSLSKVVQSHCQYKTYPITVGDDARSLAMAVYVASQSNPETKKGVRINEHKFKKAQEDFDLVERIDPYRGGTQDLFDSVELVAGERIWLPGISYVEQLKQADILPSRPDWMNSAVETGKGIAGFSVGVVEGFVQSVLDVFIGIYDMVSGIFNGMLSLVNGEMLKAASDLIAVIQEMSADEVKELAGELLTAVGGLLAKSIEDFLSRWLKDPNPYRKWHFRGTVIGYILAEVAMAIFTAAIANVVKWVGKLGKVGGKLAKIVEGLLVKLETLVPDRKTSKGKLDKPDAADGREKSAQLPFALGAARAIVEVHDAKDSAVPTVLASLAPLKKKYRWIKTFSAKRKAQSGHYEIVMHASSHTVDDDYTTEIEVTDRDLEDQIATQKIPLFSAKEWGTYSYSGRQLGIVDTLDGGPQAWYIRTGKGGAAGPGGPGKGDPSRFEGIAVLEEINRHTQRVIPARPTTKWMIKPSGGRLGAPGSPAGQANSNLSAWLKGESLPKAGPDTTDVKLLNDWLRKHGVTLGGSHQVGGGVVLLYPTKLTSMPNTQDYEILSGIVHLRRYFRIKEIP